MKTSNNVSFKLLKGTNILRTLALFLLSFMMIFMAGCKVKVKEQKINKAGTYSVDSKRDDAVIDKENYTAPSSAPSQSWSSNPTQPQESFNREEVLKGDIIEIKEKMFVAQSNDVYINPDEYLGRTFKYEGFVDIFNDEVSGNTYYAVIRYGPGCCGIDSNVGFEVILNGEPPQKNDWVEVIGVLNKYEEDGFEYLAIAVESLTVMEQRGFDTVWQ